jgi:methylenetetrahydrofolate reductase (NADPH)
MATTLGALMTPSPSAPDTDPPGAFGPISRTGGRDASKVKVSFEVFPPKTAEMEESLRATLRRLAPLSPSFVSVTYGAGGSTRDRTHRIVREMVETTALKPAAHLTCVAASRAEVDEVIREYWAAGVRHIVALRGDPPGGIGAAFTPHPDGYQNATELTAAIKAIGPFEVSVGCYPEKHPESPSLAHDIDVLKAKVDAGATRAITQFCFDVDALLRYVDKARAAGITIPIVPGVMPVASLAGLKRMAGPCGAAVPAWLENLFQGLDDDPESRKLIACSVAAEMCARLEQEGFTDLHFYTLNRADLVYAVCRMLGLRETGEIA